MTSIKRTFFTLVTLFFITSCTSDFEKEKQRMEGIYKKTQQAIVADKLDEAEMLANQLLWSYPAVTAGGADEVESMKTYWAEQKKGLMKIIDEKKELNN